MIRASAITGSIVAPTLFQPEFLHSLNPKRTYHELTEYVCFGWYSGCLIEDYFGATIDRSGVVAEMLTDFDFTYEPLLNGTSHTA